ncbi:sigma 54-interacting transcriptional regulator [Caloramator proteoclasticus]|uniref:Sigma 54 modulation protein n=1 Tax=Caloramator proteoclasticus DSM 10124 TaxID=1121262 RepID=A0A1M4T2T9_9CLOT|nr:sigma-54-dependent transcriptional regulator [Caloramator proteoclasticus]SHE38678.1 sigma 54 modulation protein [Caloramator proteoclasticus DSM 10124]
MKYKKVYDVIKEECIKQKKQTGKVIGVTAQEIAQIMNMQRSNVVREFSRLVNEGSIKKSSGRPVRYFVNEEKLIKEEVNKSLSVFDTIIGNNGSLKNQISLAKAAIVYPPKGLHTLIVGETGVGKSYFAKIMFKYAVESKMINDSNKFAIFNCADYANNPQLLISYLFGVKKGAYTGATEDRDGIIEKARDGILFLDEVHRLPPEGQEMLFTLIDEGRYVKLGSTQEIPINVMIIAATTENIESTLLKTFVRRIPVIISLPPLRERPIEERFELIKNFFEEESKRINRKIEVEQDAITALLNYDCLNNIGELKSDIQIACAKAYIRSMFGGDVLNVTLDDFNEKVKAGLLVASKINMRKLKIKTNEISKDFIEDDKYTLSQNIYEFMEKRTSYFKSKGLETNEIKNIVSNEVEQYINKYLKNINLRNEDEEVKRLINNDLFEFIKSFIPLAEYKLKRKISKNTFLGLVIHIDTFLNRVKLNKMIENPKLEEIREKYPQEFKIAMTLAEKLEEKFNVRVPLDEIGFIAMFFAAEIKENSGKVLVLVAMHGSSTATSMVEVVNHLLNTNHALAFDMPLSMKPEDALKKIEEIIKEKNEGKGALLLVDMGSLRYFDKMISNNTGIDVECVDMVTTLMAIKATRMALMNASLSDIVSSLKAEEKEIGEAEKTFSAKNKPIIISACTTGEGTAQKIKDLIYRKFDRTKYDVVNLAIKDKTEFLKAINALRKNSEIEAIVSPFKIEIEGIKYISLDSLFEQYYKGYINYTTSSEEFKRNLTIVFKEYLQIDESDDLVDFIVNMFDNLLKTFKIHIDEDELNGIIIHLGCLIEKLINKEETVKCENKELIKNKYIEIYDYLKENLSFIERKFSIIFSDDDLCNILEMILN